MQKTYTAPAPDISQEKRLTLSVIIPCYNEKPFIEKVLNRVMSVGLADEIIIVDDGSTDGTREILQRLEGEGLPGVRIDPSVG